MNASLQLLREPATFRKKLQDYLTLSKHKVVLLLVLTAWVGLGLAPNETRTLVQQAGSLLGIGLLSAAAAVLNHVIDFKIDKKMDRTSHRPISNERVSRNEALVLALTMGILGITLLETLSNRLTTVLTLLALVGYAVFYSVYLKWATPQNIVIGGLAGAMPPLLGWVSQTGRADPEAWLLVLIIFVWTPPHFWALAIHRRDDYAKANVPMLPVTHGVAYCKVNVLLYSILLFIVCLLPYLIAMSGLVYLSVACVLNGIFIYKAIRLNFFADDKTAFDVFRFSIIHLALLFTALFVDKWIY
jgi:protoheme IX farnesyltransferase